MKIGVISDTRAARPDEVPSQVVKAFEGVDLILHAGGINTPIVLDWLEKIAPVKAVGRTTGDRTENPQFFEREGGDDSRIAQHHILELEGHKIGMVHELSLRGMSDEIRPGFIEANRRTDLSLRDMVQEFFETEVDIVIFGRTLYAMVEEHQGLLFLNPGSPAFPRNMRKLGNVAILELEPGRRDVTLIDLVDIG